MGRLLDVTKATWQLLTGGRWLHDPLDRTRPMAAPLVPLGPWYYDMRRAIERGDYHLFDEKGIPRLRIPGVKGLVYHPSRIASFSIAHATRYIQDGRGEDRDTALLGARWLVASQVRDGPLRGAVPIPFDWHGSRAPRVSALTQGMVMSALARAYLMTGEEPFAVAMVEAIGPFERQEAQGGVHARFHGTGDVWYEEHPRPEGGSHILNGFVYALWGLRDTGLIRPQTSAVDLYRAGVESLARHVEAFDLGYWSSYDCPDGRPARVASLYYHHDHRFMMRIMHELEGQPVFLAMAERWDRYYRSLRCRLRVLAAKRRDL